MCARIKINAFNPWTPHRGSEQYHIDFFPSVQVQNEKIICMDVVFSLFPTYRMFVFTP
jgi:hypothetical protein